MPNYHKVGFLLPPSPLFHLKKHGRFDDRSAICTSFCRQMTMTDILPTLQDPGPDENAAHGKQQLLLDELVGSFHRR